MAAITLGGNPVNTAGNLPAIGSQAPNFTLIKNDLSTATLGHYAGKNVVLNVFPSIDTGTCAKSVREFNQAAAKLENTAVLCISKDLPFAQARFCGAENLENVETLSDFRDGNFGETYKLNFTDGPLQALHSRAVIVIDTKGKIIHTQQVAEIADEPNYQAALEALANA